MKFYRLINVGGADMRFRDRLVGSRKLRDEVLKNAKPGKYHRMEGKKMDENKSDDLGRRAEHFYQIRIRYLNGDAS